MLSPKGQLATFMAKFTKDGIGVSGLTVTVDVWKHRTKIVTAAAAIDVGDGWYDYDLAGASAVDKANYRATFDCAGDVDHPELDALWVVGPIEDTWDTTLANHLGTGSAGEALQNAQAGGGGQLTVLTQDSGNIVAGTQVGGTVADTEEEDAATWDIEHGAVFDVQITMLSTNLFISELHITAELTAHQNDWVDIQAWNVIDTAWETISTEGSRINPGLGMITSKIALNANHDDSGTVIIRFTSPSMRNTSTLSLDQVAIIAGTTGGYILTASEVADTTVAKMVSAAYGGKVYLDTVDGVDPAEITVGETGTAPFPFKTLPAAFSLAQALGDATIIASRDSVITLDQGYTELTINNESSTVGNRYSIDLNGQEVNDSVIEGADVTGVFTIQPGQFTAFKRCTLDAVNGPDIFGIGVVIAGKVSVGSSGFVLKDSLSSAQDGSAIVAFTEGTAPCHLLNYDGYIKLEGMSGNIVEASGAGILVIDATCTSGTVKVQGNFVIVDEAAGAVTILDDANYQRSVATDSVWEDDLIARTTVDSAGRVLRDTGSGVVSILDILQNSGVSIDPADITTMAQLVHTLDIVDIEDTASQLSLAALILTTFRAYIDPVSDKLVIRKSDGAELFGEHNVTVAVDALPITSVGLT